jgi:hypothetical protein
MIAYNLTTQDMSETKLFIASFGMNKLSPNSGFHSFSPGNCGVYKFDNVFIPRLRRLKC